MPAFAYKPLDGQNEIRLLELAPGPVGATLQGSLRHVRVDNVDTYEALSYVWGSSDKCKRLGTQDGEIAITASLYSALVRLRLPTSPKNIWADAVCINQDDDREKGQQIRLMTRIYRSAVAVVVFLGDEADDSNLGLAVIDNMANGNRDSVPEVSQAKMDAKLQGLEWRDAKDYAWEAYKALLRRPWLRRVWIVQEFVVARKVRMACGSWDVDWNVLAKALERSEDWLLMAIEELRDWEVGAETKATQFGRASMLELASARHEYAAGTRRPLLSLLERFQASTRETLHPRDRLFALLGMADDADDARFDPDYASPLDAVLRNYAAVFVERGLSYEMLSTAGFGERDATVASWIPDWTKPPVAGIRSRAAVLHAIFRAAADTPFSARYDSLRDHLAIRGYEVDRVARVVLREFSADELDDPRANTFKMHFLKALEVAESRTNYWTGENPHDALWRTLTANHARPTRDSAEEAPEDLDYHRHTLQGMLLDSENCDFSSYRVPTDAEKSMAGFLQASFVDLHRRYSFCVTRKGFFAMVPYRTNPDDVLCVFLGCPVPYVLRPTSWDDPRAYGGYRLVGECYLHGFMKGELINDYQGFFGWPREFKIY